MVDKERIVITGMGLMAGNGNNVKEFYQNSLEGKCGIVPSTLFDGSKLKTEYIGQIKAQLPYMTEKPEEPERIHSILKNVIEELLEDSKLTAEEISALGDRAYLSFATSLASNGRIISYVKDKNNDRTEAEWLLQIPSFVPWIKEQCGIEGGCYTTMSACAAGSTSAGIAYDLLKAGKADLVIAGGADQMTEFSCMGFHSLKALSNGICSPFDKNRDGINIGEAGAFFVFETLEHAKARNAKIYAEFLGYGINNDAYHITSPDPTGNGAYASMRMAMKDSKLAPSDIGLINAHGTGTHLNDLMECEAINKFLGDNHSTYIYSNKGMLGHCLAAAGAIELAATVLCLKHKQIMPSINVTEIMDEFSTGVLADKAYTADINYALSNSFAFAGNTASILVGAYKDDERN